MPNGIILELSPSDKVPGFYGQTDYGVGAITSASIPKVLLLVGLVSSSGGTLAPNTQIVDCFADTDADTYAGPGSELALMAYAALRIPGVSIKLATPALPSSATPATATITVSGTWSLGGQWTFRIGGVNISSGIAGVDTPQTTATAIAAYINNLPHLAVTAASAAGTNGAYVVTLTVKSPGFRGNDTILWMDGSQLPPGAVIAIAGGAGVGNGGVRFKGGAATEDITDLLAALTPGRYDRIAAAQRDSVNLGRWQAQLDMKADPLIGRMEHAIFATSTTLAAATTLAQSSLNDQRAQLLWMLDGETSPQEIAAVFGAARLQAESSIPNVSYDNYALPGVQGQTDPNSIPNRATEVAALDVGLTPITTSNGQPLVVRSITSRSLTDTGVADDRTLDTSDAVVPDAVRDDLNLYWTTSYVVQNPYVRDDPAPEEPPPPAGVATPSLWNAQVMAKLLGYQQQKWICKVATNPPQSAMNPQAPRIVSYVPTVVQPLNHQTEVTVAQIPYESAS
jgi:phage tail sheath gpL-like